MKKTHWDKKEIWGINMYYEIKMIRGKKIISLLSIMDRPDLGYDWLAWTEERYSPLCYMPLDEFLEWDKLYALAQMKEGNLMFEREFETPMEAFERANELVLADGNGSEFLSIAKLTEDVDCGYYYS